MKKPVPWKRGRGEYVRRGKYFFGLARSWGRGLEVTIIWLLRIPQALGFPVVPDVKIKAQRSDIVAFCGGEIVVGIGRLEELSVVSEPSMIGTLLKEPRFSVK